jgi:hypothetical protein
MPAPDTGNILGFHKMDNKQKEEKDTNAHKVQLLQSKLILFYPRGLPLKQLSGNSLLNLHLFWRVRLIPYHFIAGRF